MTKLHTRQKRKLRMHGNNAKGRNRQKREKTFKSMQSLEKYVKEKNLKDYSVKNLAEFKENKDKFKIVI